MDTSFVIWGFIIFGIIGLCAFFNYVPFNSLIQAMASGVGHKIDIMTLFYMKLRGTPAEKMVEAIIRANNAGVYVDTHELEAHHLAGGNIGIVVNAAIVAQKAGIKLDFPKACAIDLAGRDVLDAVNMCVNPKIIKIHRICAVAKDGIRLKVTVHITVKTDIDKLIGGAGEATLVACVCESICKIVGIAENHKKALEALKSPGMISRITNTKGLDVGTAFEILSVEVADAVINKDREINPPESNLSK